MAQPALHARQTVSALAHEDRTAGEAALQRRLAMVLGLCCFLGPAVAFFAIMEDNIAGGDSGQWVMLARAYDGRPIPSYRDPTAVPPLAPLLVLGAEHLAGGDGYTGAKLALAIALGTVALATFILARELFGLPAGVVCALLTVAGQSFFLRLTSFGALPQLLALGGFAFALAAIAIWMRTRSRASRVALGLAGAMMLLGHVPTGVTGLPIVLAALLAAPPGPALQLRRVVAWAWQRVLPLAPALAGAVLYVVAKRDTFEQYLVNEATYFQRGLGIAIGELMRMRASSVMFIVGGALLLLVLLRAVRAIREFRWDFARAAQVHPGAVRPAVVLVLPAVLIGVMAVVFHLSRVGTDYARMFPLAGLPAIVAVGALLPQRLALSVGPPRPGRWVRLAALGVVLLLFAATVPQVLAQQTVAIRYYSVRSPPDLRDALAAVDLLVPQGDTVWTPIREGKWLEGITGRAALFALPAWAIFRPWEFERKEAAETLAGGTAALVTGPMSLRFQPSAAEPRFADDPRMLVYYKGERYPVLRLDEAASRILLADGTEVPLTALTWRTEDMVVDSGVATYEQRAGPDPAGGPAVQVIRRATVAQGQPGATLVVEAVAGQPVQQLVLAFTAPDNLTRWGATVEGPTLHAEVTRFAQPFGLRVHLLDGAPGLFTLEGRRGELVLVPPAGSTSVAATLGLEPLPVGRPPSELQVLQSAELLQRFDVHWALFPLKGADRERFAARALGFEPVHVNGSYELLFRGGAP